MIAALGLAGGIAAGLATGARADGAVAEPGVVVELFTSQGCASCPPADDLLARLAQRPGVIALALHVDYWDYIGWRDRFAQPAFTERQKSYARSAGHRSIFTPQMIVAGEHRITGLRPMELVDMIQTLQAAPAQVTVSMQRNGAMLEIVITADPPLERETTVDLVRYRNSETVEIRAGENSGRTVTYHNIVQSWDSLGPWDGAGAITFHVRADGPEPAVVIVQEPGPGAIVAAARLR